MSMDMFGTVKAFIIRWFRDEEFQNAIETGSETDRAQLMQANGYQFSRSDFESAAISMMEAKERGELDDLSHDELVAVFGSGIEAEDVIYRRIKPWPKPCKYPCSKPHPGPIIQPMYGGPRPIPIDDIVRPMYGVSVLNSPTTK